MRSKLDQKARLLLELIPATVLPPSPEAEQPARAQIRVPVSAAVSGATTFKIIFHQNELLLFLKLIQLVLESDFTH